MAGGVVLVSREDVDRLAVQARGTGRVTRLLMHQGADDPFQEMLIVHPRGMRYMPHRSNQAVRSYYLLDGELVIILFDEDGAIHEHARLRDATLGGPFLIRFAEHRYHAVIVLSETATFVETAPGPFTGTEYPPWAPTDMNSPEGAAYVRELSAAVGLS